MGSCYVQSSCVSLTLLDSTQLAQSIVDLQQHADPDISTLARSLCLRWRHMAARSLELAEQILQGRLDQQGCRDVQEK